jgi:hypothetical protein
MNVEEKEARYKSNKRFTIITFIMASNNPEIAAMLGR